MTTGNGSSDDFKRAMVVTAHPDDAEYGCSATVAKWCRLGWDVVYVLCTDGSKGSDDREMSSEQLAESARFFGFSAQRAHGFAAQRAGWQDVQH